jgi:hypothetical protein
MCLMAKPVSEWVESQVGSGTTWTVSPPGSIYFTVATRKAFVVPGCPNGTPAVTTISSP